MKVKGLFQLKPTKMGHFPFNKLLYSKSRIEEVMLHTSHLVHWSMTTEVELWSNSSSSFITILIIITLNLRFNIINLYNFFIIIFIITPPFPLSSSPSAPPPPPLLPHLSHWSPPVLALQSMQAPVFWWHCRAWPLHWQGRQWGKPQWPLWQPSQRSPKAPGRHAH